MSRSSSATAMRMAVVMAGSSVAAGLSPPPAPPDRRRRSGRRELRRYTGQSPCQPAAPALGGVERLEDALALLARQARAVVADGHPEGGQAGQVARAALHLDADRRGAGGQGVLQDVAE